jgi:hypothetical protein
MGTAWRNMWYSLVLAYQPTVRGSYDDKLLGCSVRLRWLNPQGTRGSFWVGVMLTLTVKPQWVRCKLDETIEQSCSDFLAHTLEMCKVAHRYNEYSVIQG